MTLQTRSPKTVIGPRRARSRMPAVRMLRRLLLALVTSCAAVAWSTAPSAVAAYPGTNGLIALEKPNSGAVTQIWTVAANGSGLTSLTSDPNGVSDPVFSPDGTKIAFVNASGHIAVMGAGGQNVVDLTPNDPPGGTVDGSPTWSPDGSKIAFSRIDFSAASPEYDIWVMDSSSGSGQTNLTPAAGTNSTEPAWSPTGSTIAFVRGNPSAIWTIPAAGGAATQLTTVQFDATDPAWSPSGAQLAFSYQGTELWRINANGSGQNQLTNTPSVYEGASAWAPDGTAIVVRGQDANTGVNDLYMVNPSSGGETKIPNTIGGDHPDWQPSPATAPRYTVTATASPAGEGGILASVSASAGSCSGSTTATATCTVSQGASVTLTAVPAGGYAFVRWTGACAGTSAICSIAHVTANASATATFAIQPVATLPLLHALRSLHTHSQARGCTSVSNCSVLTALSPGACQQAVGGNPDVTLVAASVQTRQGLQFGCLKFTGFSTDSAGDQIFNFTSSGPIAADGVTFIPPGGPLSGRLLTVAMYSDANQQQHFQIGGSPQVSFEGLNLGQVGGWSIDPVVPASHHYASAWRSGSSGGYSQSSLPIPAGQLLSIFSVLSASPASFSGGVADVTLQLATPALLGSATAAYDLTTGTQSQLSTQAQSIPMLNDNGSAAQAASSCATALTAPFPSHVTGSFAFPSLSLAGFQFQGRLVGGDQPDIVLFEGSLSGPAYLQGSYGLKTTFEIGDNGGLNAVPFPLFACAQLQGGAVPIPVIDGSIRSLQVGIVTSPALQISGGGDMVIGTPLPFGSQPYPIDVSGNWTLSVPPWGTSGSWSIHNDNQISFLGTARATGTLDFSSVGYASAAIQWSGFNFPPPLSGLNIGAASFTGAFDQGNWNLNGDTSISYGGVNLANANVLISNLGVGACGSLLGVSVGLSLTWHGAFNPSFGSCSGETAVQSPVRPTCQSLQAIINDPNSFPAQRAVAQALLANNACVNIASSDQGAPRGHSTASSSTGFATRVTGHPPSAAFVLNGPSGAPIADLFGPNRFHCPPVTGAGVASQAGCTVFRDTAHGVTKITVLHPAAGTWIIAPASGSPPVASFGTQLGLTPPRIRATVARRGQRFLLHYRGAPADGRQVTFVEQGSGCGQVIATAHHGSGTVIFTPAPGPAGVRSIYAEIAVDGAVTQRVKLLSYHPPVARIQAPRLRTSGHGAKATLSISRVNGAVAYLVTETIGHQRFTQRIKGRSLVIPAPAPGKNTIVLSVAGVDRYGFAGHSARTRIKLTLRPPKLKPPAYHAGRKHRRHT